MPRKLSTDRPIPKMCGELNPGWKGNSAEYRTKHEWMRNHMPKSDGKCAICQKDRKLDLHNKDGRYSRNFEDWEWVCRSCHMKLDGRMNNLKQYKIKIEKGE